MLWGQAHARQQGAKSEQQQLPGAVRSGSEGRGALLDKQPPAARACMRVFLFVRACMRDVVVLAVYGATYCCCCHNHRRCHQAFDSPTYPHLAALGVDVEWNERYLLRVEGGYRPR